MSIEEIITISCICFCFYMFGRLHESIVSSRKYIERINEAYKYSSKNG